MKHSSNPKPVVVQPCEIEKMLKRIEALEAVVFLSQPVPAPAEDEWMQVGILIQRTKLSQTYVRDRLLKMKGVVTKKERGRRFVRVDTLPPGILKRSDQKTCITPISPS